jgi:hypothetical protein
MKHVHLDLPELGFIIGTRATLVFLSTRLLFQRMHGGSFDSNSLFVTFHEGRKAINISLIRSYRRAIGSGKDFVGEIGFQGFILFPQLNRSESLKFGIQPVRADGPGCSFPAFETDH